LRYSLMLHRYILLLEDLDTAFTRGITSTADPTADTNGGSVSLSGLLTSLDSSEGRCVSSFSFGPAVSLIDPGLFRQACFRHYQSR
jgi:hypothetical protein